MPEGKEVTEAESGYTSYEQMIPAQDERFLSTSPRLRASARPACRVALRGGSGIAACHRSCCLLEPIPSTPNLFSYWAR